MLKRCHIMIQISFVAMDSGIHFLLHGFGNEIVQFAELNGDGDDNLIVVELFLKTE